MRPNVHGGQADGGLFLLGAASKRLRWELRQTALNFFARCQMRRWPDSDGNATRMAWSGQKRRAKCGGGVIERKPSRQTTHYKEAGRGQRHRHSTPLRLLQARTADPRIRGSGR